MNKPASSSTHVYILGFTDGVVKVGRTGNPRQRFLTLMNEAEKRGAYLIGSWLRTTSTPVGSEDTLKAIGRMFYEFEQGREYFRAGFDEFVAKVDEYAFVWQRVVTVNTFDIGRIRCDDGLSIDDFAAMCGAAPKQIRKRLISGELYPDVRNGLSLEQARRFVDSLPYAKEGA